MSYLYGQALLHVVYSVGFIRTYPLYKYMIIMCVRTVYINALYSQFSIIVELYGWTSSWYSMGNVQLLDGQRSIIGRLTHPVVIIV